MESGFDKDPEFEIIYMPEPKEPVEDSKENEKEEKPKEM